MFKNKNRKMSSFVKTGGVGRVSVKRAAKLKEQSEVSDIGVKVSVKGAAGRVENQESQAGFEAGVSASAAAEGAHICQASSMATSPSLVYLVCVRLYTS